MQVKSVKTGSVFWAACTSLSYFYMVSKIRNKHFVYEELYVVFLVDLVSQSLIVLKSWSFYSLSTSPCWKEKPLTQTAVGYFFCTLKGAMLQEYSCISVLQCGSILCWSAIILVPLPFPYKNAPVVLLRKVGKESWPNFFNFQSMSIRATDPQLTGISFNV